MLGPILAAGASIVGGLLQNKSAKDANKAAAAQWQQNYEAQKEFAQKALTWKARDAERAGISKVFAMGAPTMGFSPSSVGYSPSDYSFLGDAGQNVGRAMEQGMSNPARVDKLGRTAAAIQLEGLSLDNDIKRAQLASIVRTNSQPGSAPGIPGPNTVSFIPGQGNGAQGDINVSTKLDTASSVDPSAVPGTTPELLTTRTNTGGYSVALPPALQEAYESMGILPQMQWNYRNIIRPYSDPEKYAPRALKELADRQGQSLSYNLLTGEYYLVPKRIRPRYKEWR